MLDSSGLTKNIPSAGRAKAIISRLEAAAAGFDEDNLASSSVPPPRMFSMLLGRSISSPVSKLGSTLTSPAIALESSSSSDMRTGSNRVEAYLALRR